MDSSGIITKETFFAADAIPEVKQYEYAKPSTILSMLVRNSKRGDAFEYEQSTLQRMVNFMPETMVGLNADSKGEIVFEKKKTADFLGAGSSGSSIAGSGIVPILVMDSIMEGAMPYTCAREILDTVQMRTETETMPFFTARGTVAPSAYGAEAYDLAEDIGKGVAEAKSYKITCGIARELLDDSQGDLMSEVLREIGATMELTLETTVLKGLLDNANATTTTAAAGGELAGLVDAQGVVGLAGYRPSGAIMSPVFCAGAMKSFIPAYNETAQSWIAGNNIIANWAGLKLGRSGVTVPSWGWANASDVGAVVVDRSRAGKIGIREDMKFDEFDNITKWLKNPVCVSRFCYAAPVDKDKPKRNNKGAIQKIVKSA